MFQYTLMFVKNFNHHTFRVMHPQQVLQNFIVQHIISIIMSKSRKVYPERLPLLLTLHICTWLTREYTITDSKSYIGIQSMLPIMVRSVATLLLGALLNDLSSNWLIFKYACPVYKYFLVITRASQHLFVVSINVLHYFRLLFNECHRLMELTTIWKWGYKVCSLKILQCTYSTKMHTTDKFSTCATFTCKQCGNCRIWSKKIKGL